MMTTRKIMNLMTKRLYILCCFTFLLLPGVLSCASNVEVPEASARVEKPAPVDITFQMSCEHCGMRPAKNPQWNTQVIYDNNSVRAYDSCKCMYGSLLKKQSPYKILAIWIKDYESGQWIDGTEAYYVVGSSMNGPMGPDLVPFANQGRAATFQKGYGGSIIRYQEITMATLDSMHEHMQSGHDHAGHEGNEME